MVSRSTIHDRRDRILFMRTRRGLVVSGLLSGLVVLGVSAAGGHGSAAATEKVHENAHEHVHEHGEEHDDDGAEHMAEDLVGTSVTQIEKQTAATAKKIQKATGVRPGTSRQKAAVATDPGLSGSWS